MGLTSKREFERPGIAGRDSRRTALFLIATLALLVPTVSSQAVEAKQPRDRSPNWAFKSLTLPAVPKVSDPKLAARVRNPVDAFVTAKLVEHGLTPSPEADRRTLIRRLSYDL